jgi:hypothetical protein
MAKRETRLITKNSNIVNRPLPNSLLQGEAIVNTAQGIVFYSGVTTSTNEWVPAGTGTTANFFEVGSNLYDLKIRNQITSYSGLTNLSGKFLSGSTSGFVLADISNIVGVDTYVTGSTLTPASDNTNLQSSELLFNITPSGGPYFIDTENTYTTGGTYDNNTALITFEKNDGTDYTVDLSSLDVNDTFVTGGTYFTGGTLELEYNTGGSFQITGLTADLDAEIAGLAETDEQTIELDLLTNKIRLKDIVAAASGGTRVFLGNTEIGTGGSLDVAGTGDLIVNGNLTVFGTETIVATNDLYVEDPQITLNYNATGSTILTSVSSGIRIQDGNGVVSGDTYFTVGLMQTLVSGDTTEYTGLTGYENRGWVTQLNDIVIRNTNLNDGAPDGVRVLAEGDILDGGQY